MTLRDLVSAVLYGINTTVFAYGATGSGKTYTMVGECFGEPAVVSRASAVVPGLWCKGSGARAAVLAEFTENIITFCSTSGKV